MSAGRAPTLPNVQTCLQHIELGTFGYDPKGRADRDSADGMKSSPELGTRAQAVLNGMYSWAKDFRLTASSDREDGIGPDSAAATTWLR